VTLAWGGGQGNAGYHAQLLDSAAKVLLDQPGLDVAARDTHFDFDAHWLPGPYKAQVQGTHGDAKTVWVGASFQRLAAPTVLQAHNESSISAPDCGVMLSWAAVPEAQSYVLSSMHAGSTWGPDRNIEPPQPQQAPPTQCVVTFEAAAPAGNFGFSLVTHGSSTTVASPASDVLTLVRLDQPLNLQASSAGSNVTLRWQAVANATRYQAVIHSAGSPLQVTPLQASAQGQEWVAKLTLTGAAGSPRLYQLQVQAIPAEGQSDIVPGVPSTTVEVTITLYASAVEMATALNSQKVDGVHCAQQLLDAFPSLNIETLASAMAQGGYAVADTSKGLMAVWPQTSPQDLAAALTQAYPDPVQMASRLFARGVPGADCGPQLLHTFPTLTLDTLASTMAKGGYAVVDTSKGLLAVWPQTPPQALAEALIQAYPGPVQTARALRAQGATGVVCATSLHKAFPELVAKDLAAAMAQAGYPAEDTGAGLTAVFPGLSPLDLSIALVSAYH
jgi:hypothetical protein